MKKRVFAVIYAVFCVVFLVSCVPASGGNEIDMPVVYTSFYPLYDFAVKIADGRADVRILVPAGVDPHDWEPNASDIAALERADMFIYNGAGLEFWAGNVLSVLENKSLIIVEAARGLADEEAFGFSHDYDGEHGNLNPHVWLDPMKAKLQAEAVAAGLIEASPGNREIYEESLAKWRLEFDKLDGEFRGALSKLSKRDIIVAHEAFGYMCGAYGLTQHAIAGVSPEMEPSPARMAEIIKLAQTYDINTIFFEELISPKIAETIAGETGAETAVLSPLEGLSDEQRTNGGDYFSVMRENLAALVKALS